MRVYDTIIAKLFTPWARDLIDRLAPPLGCAALDVACGPGTVSRVLAERIGRDGHLVATDISPAMLDVARSKPVGPESATIEWLEAPAAPLPVSDSAVDIVTCQQGLQFFPDKIRALAEMRRVLRSGGRAGVAVWTRVGDQVFGYLRDAIVNLMSSEIADRYLGPFLLTGEDVANYALRAGFANVKSRASDAACCSSRRGSRVVRHVARIRHRVRHRGTRKLRTRRPARGDRAPYGGASRWKRPARVTHRIGADPFVAVAWIRWPPANNAHAADG